MVLFAPALFIAAALGALLWRWVLSHRRAEKRFEDALEAAPNGMMVVERDGVISFANSEARRLFASDLVGESVETFIAPEARANHRALREGYLFAPTRRGMGKGRDLIALSAKGRSFPVEIGLNPIERHGRAATLAAVVDITERKKAESALLRSNAELEQFAYLASHDMQEPLRMVASYTQLLGERYRGRLDEKADRYIGYATEGVVRMQTLVRDLLSYSRVTSEPHAKASVDLADVVADTLAQFRERLRECGGEVSVSALPAVVGNRIQLERVFSNLFANALKFRADAPPLVSVSAERSGVMVVISVADNGIGIDPRHFERVFLMFQRLHERGKYEGSGIGLAIVKKIVEGHGGKVWLHRPEGQGTRISFTLPAADVADEAANSLVAGGR